MIKFGVSSSLISCSLLITTLSPIKAEEGVTNTRILENNLTSPSSEQLYADSDFDLDNIIPPESDYMPLNSPSLEQTPYTLDAGDLISIDIFNVPEYSKTYQVLIDGSINLPLINKVSVVGMTIPELQNLVTQMYSERRLLVDPIISINLVAPRPINVSVTGDVRNPGSYVIPFRIGENRDRAELGSVFPTLIDALKIAKGINASADEQRIQVIRSYKGTQRAYFVNLRQFLNEGDLAQDITLRDDDRIVVPSAESIDRETVLRRANADFSAELNVPVSINIVGEINRPGPYTLNADEVQSNLDDQLGLSSSDLEEETSTNNKFATISTAIRSAGGVTGKADLRNIEIRRTLPSGQKQTITANLWKLLQEGDLNQDTLLQEGDTIIVPRAQTIDTEELAQIGIASFSPNSINVNIVGEVKSPGTKELSPRATLQDAVLAAGGFDDVRAREGEVELVRLNPNGTLTRTPIQVNFSAEVNDSSNNPSLLNNDIIVVKPNGFARIGDFTETLTLPVRAIFNLINPFLRFTQ